MNMQIKICPDCSTEYFAHIENCADCGTALLSLEENKLVLEERKGLEGKSLENSVAVRSGDLNWIDELFNALIDSGIPCVVTADNGCNKGCSGDAYHLVVSLKDTERANERIEEYFREVHPEVRASTEMMSQGKCPACSSPVGADETECPDCGLMLIIEE